MSALRALGALRSTERTPDDAARECTTWENSVASQRFAPSADRLGLYCVEIRTADWEKSVRWYRETLGLKVLVWTVNDPPTMERMLDMGIDGLITDRPDLGRKALEARGIRWR